MHQIGVEGEYILGVDISSERSDQLTLIAFLDKLEDLTMKFENVITDTGFIRFLLREKKNIKVEFILLCLVQH